MSTHNGISVSFGAPLIVQPPPTFSKTLVILGMAPGGPPNTRETTPIGVDSAATAYGMFGIGSLTRACEQAFLAGAKSVYLVRLNRDGEELTNDADPSVRESNLGTIYERLQSAYAVINDLPVHIVVPVDVYLDDTVDFASQLAVSMYNKRDSTAIGIIGVKPIDKDESVEQYITRLALNGKIDNGFYIVDGSELVDIGYKLSVVASTIDFIDSNHYINTVNGASAYAGLVASLDSHVSPTNKRIAPVYSICEDYSDGVVTETISIDETPTLLKRVPFRDPAPIVIDTTLNSVLTEGTDYTIDYARGLIASCGGTISVSIEYKYSDTHTLASHGYVVFRNNIRRGCVPVQAVTAAHPQSQLHSLHTVRVVHEIVARINAVSDRLIGEPMNKIALVESTAETALRHMQSVNAIRSYDCSATSNEPGHTLHLNLAIVPVGEVDSVHTLCRLAIQE